MKKYKFLVADSIFEMNNETDKKLNKTNKILNFDKFNVLLKNVEKFNFNNTEIILFQQCNDFKCSKPNKQLLMFNTILLDKQFNKNTNFNFAENMPNLQKIIVLDSELFNNLKKKLGNSKIKIELKTDKINYC